MNTLQDKIRGSLIGGAIGDALGYPVEFIYSFEGIQTRYGERGITRLDTKQHWLDETEQVGKAVVSDDTQMTLFTANGLLNVKHRKERYKYCICEAYIEWYLTQIGKKSPKYRDCWISDVPELNHRRAPGKTCMSSLGDIYRGKEPMNNSKGCGGVMRIAPIPLYASVQDRMRIEEADLLAAETSEITHQHPLGFIPSAFTAHVIYRLAQDASPDRQKCKEYVKEALDKMNHLFSMYGEHLKYFTELIETAVACSEMQSNDVETIEQKIGGGWVAEETAAIAIYCALKYFDNFEEAMIASVNHAGDSDSTGAVTGNILGAALGYEAIPQHFKNDLEMHELILHMADDLYRGYVTYSRLVLAYLNPDPESIADKQKRYQQAIEEWASKSDRTRKKEIATQDTQYIQPMDEHVAIPMDFYIPNKAWAVIRQGHISHSMEDKWFMYCDESKIRFYRSWTGFCVYVAVYENVNDGIHICQLQSSRVPSCPNPMFDKEDVELFLQLIMEDLTQPPF